MIAVKVFHLDSPLLWAFSSLSFPVDINGWSGGSICRLPAVRVQVATHRLSRHGLQALLPALSAQETWWHFEREGQEGFRYPGSGSPVRNIHCSPQVHISRITTIILMVCNERVYGLGSDFNGRLKCDWKRCNGTIINSFAKWTHGANALQSCQSRREELEIRIVEERAFSNDYRLKTGSELCVHRGGPSPPTREVCLFADIYQMRERPRRRDGWEAGRTLLN